MIFIDYKIKAQRYSKIVDTWEKIDLNHLQNKIHKYKNIDKSNFSYENLFNLINSTILFEGFFAMPILCCPFFNNNTCFYRGRNNRNDESFFNWGFNQYWEKPISYSNKYERLSVPNENPLYLSSNIPTVISEVRAQKGDIVIISKYKLKDNCVLTPLDFTHIYNGFISELGNLNIGISNYAKNVFKEFINFFSYLFNSKDTLKSDLIYKQSNSIVRNLYDYPMSDGWFYHSIQQNNITSQNINYCFKTKEAHKKLSLNGSIAIKMNSDNNIIFGYLRPSGSNQWEICNKENLKKEFPEIVKLLIAAK